jgi:hypothetical protein
MIIGCIWKKVNFFGIHDDLRVPQNSRIPPSRLARLIQPLKVVLHADWADPLMRTKKNQACKEARPI